MKQKLFIAVAICLALLANNLRAELTQTDAERLCKHLKVTNVKCFDEARAQLKARPAATEYLKDYPMEKTLQSQVSPELEKILPQIEKALRATPDELALVSVTVDSSTSGTATQYNLRSMQFEGVGDAALQALAPGILSGAKFGSLDRASAKGFNFDANHSHIICFGLDGGKIKATPISLSVLRTTLTAAVGDAQKSVAFAPPGPPVAPTGLRIQIVP